MLIKLCEKLEMVIHFYLIVSRLMESGQQEVACRLNMVDCFPFGVIAWTKVRCFCGGCPSGW